jgi:hypothetical protein
MDKIDGPYYFFGVLARLARLPRLTPIALPDSGRTNIVPVDYVAEALVTIMGLADRDGQTFHLTAPESIGLRGIYRAVERTAGLPPVRAALPRAVAAPFLAARGRAKVWRNMAVTQLGIPAEILDVVDLAPTFTTDNTREALRGTRIDVPDFASYAPVLWRYWAQHLDPERARRSDGPTHSQAGTSSSPAPPVGSVGLRRSRWQPVGPRFSPWPAMRRRSMIWSPRSAPRVVRRTPSPAMSPIPRRSSTP